MFYFLVGHHWEFIMKTIQIFGLACVLGMAWFTPGCATDNSLARKAPPLPEGISLHQDKDVQGVWVAPGFNFKGYDTLYIGDADFEAIERPNEKRVRELAIYALQEEFVIAARNSELFKKVVVSTNDIPSTGRTLRLNNTIIEYEKGGGGARYWAGMFGGGQPVIKVRGLVYENDKLLFVFEARRSGESAGARLAGVWMSDEEIQRNDIRDLAVDVVECMRRIAGISAKE